MEFKGTKGEWKIGANSILETEVVCGRIRVAQAKHYNTDNTGFFKHDPTIDEGHANAQLIAGSPKLLEYAIKKAKEGCEEAKLIVATII